MGLEMDKKFKGKLRQNAHDVTSICLCVSVTWQYLITGVKSFISCAGHPTREFCAFTNIL